MEIMVVIAIIVILAGITLAVGLSVKQRSAIKATKAQLLTLKQMMKSYLENNPEFLITQIVQPVPPLSPISDTSAWVRALRSTKDGQTLDNMPQTPGRDMILDSFGSPIYYVPRGQPGVIEDYFWSAGPNKLWGDADDIRSTEAN